MHTPIFMGSLLEIGAVLRRRQSNADQASRPAGGWFSLLQYEHAAGRYLSGDTPREAGTTMSDMLGAWGRWVYRFRWWLLAASALSLAPASVILIQCAHLEVASML